MNASALDLMIIAPALLAGVLVLLTHVPLGAQVLQRGIVFIDLAIAQIAALGVIVAGILGLDPQGWTVQLAAGMAALSGALLLTWTEKKWPQVQEAQIGALFVLAATGGVLLVANNPHGSEHLHDLLAGQILWVNYSQLALPAIINAFILGALILANKQLGRIGFYVLFALAVTVSVQLVGVYLVFASLIIPSLGVRQFDARSKLGMAFAVGICGYAAGLILSTLYDLPAGALIVWSLAVLSILAYAFGPKHPAAPITSS